MEKERNNLFQVNLKGMITPLSEHTCSNPNTFVRELLQNCADIIIALRGIDENHKSRVDVSLDEDKTVVFRDNGIGLKEEEVYRSLTVIGESSKQDTPDADDFIGRSGIGLLSCFMVTSEITVESHSVMGRQPVRWCRKVGGTYLPTSSDEKRPIGSQVGLHPEGDWMHLFEYEISKKILVGYGEALSHPIHLYYQGEEELVNMPSPAWLDLKAICKELLDYGVRAFQSSALDAFRIYIKSGKVEGVLYVLPFCTQFSMRNSHKAYLKRMLLNEDDCNLLSLRIFFIHYLVNVDGLLSTASRESLVSNDQLKDARREIGVAIKDYLRGLVQNDRVVFNRILDAHYFHIKAIAPKDNELLCSFMDYLPLETNKGLRSSRSIYSASNVICYIKNLEDFRQVRRIVEAQGWLVVNAAYTFDEMLLKKYVRLNPELILDEVSPSRLLEQSGEVGVNQELQASEVKANELLKRFGCICRLKYLTPVDIPVIFVVKEKENVAKNASNPLAAVLGAVNVTKQIPSTLTFNVDNEMVQTLLQIQGDNKLFQHVVHILYVQSLPQGKYLVNSEEMELFSYSLSELMTPKMNDFINFLN